MARNGMELRVALECHQLATANRLVAAGQGGSVVPSLLRGQVTALGARCVRLGRPVSQHIILNNNDFPEHYGHH